MELSHAVSLPFAESALEPVISSATMELHFRRHHLGYLSRFGNLVRGTPFEHRPLEDVVESTYLSCGHCEIFNNAAQAWNHRFFWQTLCPTDAGGAPGGEFLRAVRRSFGSVSSLKRHLAVTAQGRFGSGWLWLTLTRGRLDAYTTANADTPAATPGVCPLLTVDLWEHAFYLDWQNRRGSYVEAVLDRLVDWHAVSRRYAEACATRISALG